MFLFIYKGYSCSFSIVCLHQERMQPTSKELFQLSPYTLFTDGVNKVFIIKTQKVQFILIIITLFAIWLKNGKPRVSANLNCFQPKVTINVQRRRAGNRKLQTLLSKIIRLVTFPPSLYCTNNVQTFSLKLIFIYLTLLIQLLGLCIICGLYLHFFLPKLIL